MPPINLKLSKKLFNDVYFPYLTDYSKRYNIFFGGAGSGKSVFIAQKLLVKACKSKRKILVIRKFGTTLRDSVFQLIIDLLKQWQLYAHCTVNLSTYTIILPNESVFLFKGLDDSEKIKSITDITDIFCEEATELTEDDFTQLDLRLRALMADLQLYVSFNPVSKANWVYKKWFDPKNATYDKEATFILKTTYKDNRFLPKAYIRALEEKALSNPVYYKIYALGEFAVAEGLVITNWRKENFDPMALAKKYEHRVGMDLGFVDPSAVIETLYDRENKTIYVFAEFYKKGCQLSELAAAIFEMGLRKVKIMVDAAEPRSREYFRNKGINAQPCIKGADSVKSGIMFLQDHTIVVHPNCPNFIMELENFSYIKSKKTGEWTEDMTHEWSHAIDACRYAYSDVYTNKKAKTMSKSALGL
jgi:phage terminase large subunit